MKHLGLAVAWLCLALIMPARAGDAVADVRRAVFAALTDDGFARDAVKITPYKESSTQPTSRPTAVFVVDSRLVHLRIPQPVEMVSFNVSGKSAPLQFGSKGDWGQEQYLVQPPPRDEEVAGVPQVRPKITICFNPGTVKVINLRPGTTEVSLDSLKPNALTPFIVECEHNGAGFGLIVVPPWSKCEERVDSRRFELHITDGSWPHPSMKKRLLEAGLSAGQIQQLITDAEAELLKSTDEDLCRRMLVADSESVLQASDVGAAVRSALCMELNPSPYLQAAFSIQSEGQTVYVVEEPGEFPGKRKKRIFRLYAFDGDGKTLWTGSVEVPSEKLDRQQLLADIATMVHQ